MRTDDGYIISRCLNDEPEAFGLLVEKYKAGVYAFVLAKLHNFHDAEDVTQDVFIRAYRSLHTLKRWDSFIGWLYRIATNLSKDFLLKRSKRPDHEFIEDQAPEMLDENSINNCREDMAYESLQEALNSLPESYRDVLMLYYMGGMDSVEIAKALCTSPVAIRHRLSRARAQLKEAVLAMMSKTLEQQKLPASFTFRIVEAVKRIRIHPISTAKSLPWGISIAAGILLTIMSLNTNLARIIHFDTPAYSPLPVESKVLKVGEIPVDVIKISQTSVISSQVAKGKGGEPIKPDKQNTLFLAPQGTGVWTKKTDMPSKRMALSTCVVDGKIYAIGGVNDFNSRTPVLEEYDPATDTWTPRANMPTAKAFTSVGVVNGKIYVIGGEILDGWAANVDEYDPENDRWTMKSQMPTKRESSGTVVLNGKIYIIGGMINSGQNMVALSTVEVYDPATDTFAKKTDMLRPRVALTAAAVNGKIYVFGGFYDKYTPDAPLAAEVEEYDPVNDVWTKKSANIPTPRLGLSSFVMNGKIYVIGGSTPPGNIFAAVEEYDPVADKWEKMPDMLAPRWCFDTSIVNGKAYAIGGTNAIMPWRANAILPAVEEYTPEDWQPNNVFPQKKLPTKWGEIKDKQ